MSSSIFGEHELQLMLRCDYLNRLRNASRLAEGIFPNGVRFRTYLHFLDEIFRFSDFHGSTEAYTVIFRAGWRSGK
jgi:hypothetical protein